MIPNLERTPLDKLPVRQASNLAIDRERMVKQVLFGQGRAASGPMATTLWAFDPSLRAFAYDPAKANQLLDAAGLGAGVRYVLGHGVPAIREHEVMLICALAEGLTNIPGVTVYGPADAMQPATLSFTVADRRVSEIGLRLDEEHGVLCRVGLHCAPAAHRTIGTFPDGTVRVAAGLTISPEDVKQAVAAVMGTGCECADSADRSQGRDRGFSTDAIARSPAASKPDGPLFHRSPQ